MTLKNDQVNFKKMMKNGEKKSFKNNKLQHVLLYHFLNDESHSQIASPGKKKFIRPHVLRHE